MSEKGVLRQPDAPKSDLSHDRHQVKLMQETQEERQLLQRTKSTEIMGGHNIISSKKKKNDGGNGEWKENENENGNEKYDYESLYHQERRKSQEKREKLENENYNYNNNNNNNKNNETMVKMDDGNNENIVRHYKKEHGNYDGDGNNNENSNHKKGEITRIPPTIAPTPRKKKPRVTYRIKNEKFQLWDYYEPVRILGYGAYAVVMFSHVWDGLICLLLCVLYVYVVCCVKCVCVCVVFMFVGLKDINTAICVCVCVFLGLLFSWQCYVYFALAETCFWVCNKLVLCVMHE